jgi:hypothetical protein
VGSLAVAYPNILFDPFHTAGLSVFLCPLDERRGGRSECNHVAQEYYEEVE